MAAILVTRLFTYAALCKMFMTNIEANHPNCVTTWFDASGVSYCFTGPNQTQSEPVVYSDAVKHCFGVEMWLPNIENVSIIRDKVIKATLILTGFKSSRSWLSIRNYTWANTMTTTGPQRINAQNNDDKTSTANPVIVLYPSASLTQNTVQITLRTNDTKAFFTCQGLHPNCAEGHQCDANNGTCFNIAGVGAAPPSFFCQCPFGQTGKNCENRVCTSNPCQNDARCGLVHGTPRCYCIGPWQGRFCDTWRSLCDSQHCRNGGTCNDGPDEEIRCNCLNGFSGWQCEKCAGKPCENGGKCRRGSDDEPVCNCPPGWIGTWCEKNLDECEETCFDVGQICTDTPGSYICNCTDGFHHIPGSKLCAIQQDTHVSYHLITGILIYIALALGGFYLLKITIGF